MNNRYKIISTILISPTVVAIILVIIFGLNGIYPGSGKTVLIYDMAGQYVSFFAYLHSIGEGYNSIFFQTFSGFGSGFYGTWAYYLSSPLSLFTLLFDVLHLPDAIYLLTILKISLCALSFSIYLSFGRLKIDKSLILFTGALSYSLMSYNLMYSMNIMWLDGVIMLPLVILGIDILLEKDKKAVFITALACAIIFNYYTAYMICLFVVVYFLYCSFILEMDRKVFFLKGLALSTSGIVSVLMSLFVLLPVVLELKSGKLSESDKYLYGIVRSPLGVLRTLLPFSKPDFNPNGNPPLYCGIIIFAFMILYFCSRRVSPRKKIASFCVMFMFIVSMCWDKMDLVWHGFQIPNMYPARYCFLLAFYIISLGVEAISLFLNGNERINRYYFVAVLCLLIDLPINSFNIISKLNTDEIVGPYLDRNVYQAFFDEYSGIDIGAYSLIVSDEHLTYNDGLMYGIPMINYYSSSYKGGLSEFYKGIGLDSERHVVSDRGLCSLSGLLLGVDAYYNNTEYINTALDTGYKPSDDDRYPENIYLNPDSVTLGYALNESGSINDPFSYNAFENLNEFNYDVTGLSESFKECRTEISTELVSEEGQVYFSNYIVYPEADRHLLFYVSYEDFDENLMGENYDCLYFRENPIAIYENTRKRFIVDMGVSDGTPLEFTFVSGSGDSRVWFYSFNEDVYHETAEIVNNRSIYDVIYSSKGISGKINAASDMDYLILLSFDKGYTITVDGEVAEYSSYRNAYIKLPVKEGEHEILITYMPPGLKLASVIAIITTILFIIGSIYCKKCIKK